MLGWQISKFDENYNQFKTRVSQYSDGDEIEEADDDSKNIPWNIRENIGWGTVKGLRRKDGSLQKDCVNLNPYNIPEQFSIAVVGHQGWKKNINEVVPYSIAVSFEVLNAEIDVYNLIPIISVFSSTPFSIDIVTSKISTLSFGLFMKSKWYYSD